MAKNWDQARWAQHRRTPAKRPMLTREVGPLPGVNLIADTDTHACEACGYHVCGCSIDYDWQRKKLGIIAGGSAAHEAMEYLRRKSEAVMAAPECVSEPEGAEREGWAEQYGAYRLIYRDSKAWRVIRVAGAQWFVFVDGSRQKETYTSLLAAQQHVEAAYATAHKEPEDCSQDLPPGWSVARSTTGALRCFQHESGAFVETSNYPDKGAWFWQAAPPMFWQFEGFCDSRDRAMDLALGAAPEMPDGWEEVRMGKAYLQRERKWLVAQSPRGWVRITGCCDGYCIDAGIQLAASVSVVDGPIYDTAREAMEAADAPR